MNGQVWHFTFAGKLVLKKHLDTSLTQSFPKESIAGDF